MRIEFTTSIDDYKFPYISEKIVTALKENMINTLFYERVPVLNFIKTDYIIENQTHWNLI